MKRSQLKRGKPMNRGNGIQRTRMKVRRFNKKPTTDGASLKEVRDECDALVRTIIALRDHKCFTCWAHQGLVVGHLFRRGIEIVRWNLKNCNAACVPCNGLHETNPEYYIGAFVQRFGEQAYNELRAEAHQRGKLTYIELLAIRDGLRQEAARMAQ